MQYPDLQYILMNQLPERNKGDSKAALKYQDLEAINQSGIPFNLVAALVTDDVL